MRPLWRAREGYLTSAGRKTGTASVSANIFLAPARLSAKQYRQSLNISRTYEYRVHIGPVLVVVQL